MAECWRWSCIVCLVSGSGLVRIKAPKDVHTLTPGIEYVTLRGILQMWLRTLRWGVYSGSSGWIQSNCKVFIKGRLEGQCQRERGSTALALKMEEWPWMKWPSEAGNVKERHSPLRGSRRNAALPFHFRLRTSTIEIINLCCFQPPSLWWFIPVARGNSYRFLLSPARRSVLNYGASAQAYWI